MYKIILPCKTLLVVMTILAISWFIQGTAASALRPYNTQMEDKTKQEVAALASRMIKLIMYDGNDGLVYNKRNGGTADTLYNMPDLMSIGR
uniref:Cerebrin 2 n=1 Tax=Deroceras reticulatum TaxID=145610 RepID=A0A1X9WEC6_DERRE|nr:cerebrin 2 [Deroceras reticulatum]